MSDQTERADFEAWVDEYNAAHTNWQFSMSSPISDHCWAAWQARAAQPAPSIDLMRAERAVGYREGYEAAIAAQPAAEPVAMVAVSHESFGCFWLGNVPPEGTKLYAHPAPAAEPQPLRLAAKAALGHWNEFGPEHGLDEVMDQLRRVLAAAPQAAEPLSDEDLRLLWLDFGKPKFANPNANVTAFARAVLAAHEAKR